MAVEELFCNVCNYAYPDATPQNPGEVCIGLHFDDDDIACIADVGCSDSIAFLDIDGELSVHVGHCASLGIANLDDGTHDGLTFLLVFDYSAHLKRLAILLCRGSTFSLLCLKALVDDGVR